MFRQVDIAYKEYKSRFEKIESAVGDIGYGECGSYKLGEFLQEIIDVIADLDAEHIKYEIDLEEIVDIFKDLFDRLEECLNKRRNIFYDTYKIIDILKAINCEGPMIYSAETEEDEKNNRDAKKIIYEFYTKFCEKEELFITERKLISYKNFLYSF